MGHWITANTLSKAVVWNLLSWQSHRILPQALNCSKAAAYTPGYTAVWALLCSVCQDTMSSTFVKKLPYF